jgi:Sigma-70 region 2
VRPGFRRSIRKIDATAGDPQAASNRPSHMNRPLAEPALAPVPVQRDADRALTAMYGDHYRCLVRLAVLLVQDVTTAEDVVQDSFVALHTASRRLRDGDRALGLPAPVRCEPVPCIAASSDLDRTERVPTRIWQAQR